MAIAASDLVAQFRQAYKGATDTMGYDYLNRVDIPINRTFRHFQKWIVAALTAYDEDVELAEGVLWVRECRYCARPNGSPNQGRPGVRLTETTEDSKDVGETDHRAANPGAPQEHYQTHDDTGGRLGIYPASSKSTLTVSAATNASPIVITSSAAHGLADGDRVDIFNAAVNTAANGEWYAKVTGYSTTTFALYSDSALTVPVAGNGIYTTGGLILCENSPLLQLKVAWHETLSSGSSMPSRPLLKSLYITGMCMLHAEKFDTFERWQKFKAIFDDALANQDALTFRRVGFKPRRMDTIGQRSSIAVRQTRF